jgi:hypothetical protein
VRNRGISNRHFTPDDCRVAVKNAEAMEAAMRTNTSRRYVTICLVALLLTGLTAESLAQVSKGNVYFKKQLKIPYNLQDGSTVLKAGEYTLKIQNEGGLPVMTFFSKDGYPVLINHGDRDTIPEQEQDFKEGGRFRMMAIPDTKRPGSHWIVFVYDFVDSKVGKYVRFRFRIAEATAPAS